MTRPEAGRADIVRRRRGGLQRRLGRRGPAATMTQQGAALQNYNNELVKCEWPRGEAGGQEAGFPYPGDQPRGQHHRLKIL